MYKLSHAVADNSAKETLVVVDDCADSVGDMSIQDAEVACTLGGGEWCLVPFQTPSGEQATVSTSKVGVVHRALVAGTRSKHS
jgi:hypothetical protein